MNEGMMPVDNYCEDCKQIINLNKNKLFYLQSEDGLVKVICKLCLDSYDKEERILH